MKYMRFFTSAVVITVLLTLIYIGTFIPKYNSFLDDTVVSGEYIIEKGDSYMKIYKTLFAGHRPPAGFNLYLTQIKRIDKKLHYGYYEADNITLRQLLDNVMSGRQTLFKVTFPEGYNMYDIAGTLENAGISRKSVMLKTFLSPKVIHDLTGADYESLEGFLAPGTYFFSKNYPPEKIAGKMVTEFFKTLPESFEQRARSRGLSFYDALILASIVQKETYMDSEAPMVASVFLNRIKKRMLLQADPTIIYGIYHDFDGKIRKADINNADNRFNTYKHRGLPPTPISNPSVMALEAVVNPAHANYYYFVATKNGEHVFSETYDEHRRNVRIHQLGLSK